MRETVKNSMGIESSIEENLKNIEQAIVKKEKIV